MSEARGLISSGDLPPFRIGHEFLISHKRPPGNRGRPTRQHALKNRHGNKGSSSGGVSNSLAVVRSPIRGVGTLAEQPFTHPIQTLTSPIRPTAPYTNQAGSRSQPVPPKHPKSSCHTRVLGDLRCWNIGGWRRSIAPRGSKDDKTSALCVSYPTLIDIDCR